MARENTAARLPIDETPGFGSIDDEMHCDLEKAIDRIVSDRSAMGRLLREHRLFKEAIENSPVAYCVYDSDDRLIALNGAYENLHNEFGCLRKRIARGEKIYFADIMRSKLKGQVPDDQLESAVAQRVRAQRVSDGTPIERDNGERGFYQIVKYKLSGGAIAGMAFDITDRKRREAELGAAKAEAEAAGQRANAALKLERSRKREARLLSELSEWLQSCKSLEELFDVVTRFMASMFPDSSGELYIYSNSRDVLDGACHWNRGDGLEAHIQPDDCWALRRGRLYKYGAGIIDFPCSHADDADPETPYLCLPIVAHGDTVGLLHIRFDACSNVSGEVEASPFDKGVHAFAIQCSEQISLAIANVTLRDELRDQSTRDPLTGLFNRRHFLEQCRSEIGHAGRYAQTIGLISIDADNFKIFNDTHGHDAGDTVLRAIGEIMSGMFDDAEVVSRFGGEEFSILLPNASIEDTEARARELCERIETLSIRYGDKMLPNITISAGVAGYPIHGQSPQCLLKAADKALYAAKDSGRNTVRIAEACDISTGR